MRKLHQLRSKYINQILFTAGLGIAMASCGVVPDNKNVGVLSEAEADDRFETIELLSNSIILAPNTFQSVEIPRGWRHIRRLTVSAEGIGRDGMFEVVVNDDIKGTIYVPGRDPVYVVTVAEGAKNIELKHTHGGQIRISSILATVSVVSTNPGSGGGSIGGEGRAYAANVSYHTIELSDAFHPQISVSDWETYVLPIKIAAGRTYALARASGDLSGRVHNSLISLIAQMTLADSFVDRALRNNATFDLAVELLATRNNIEELLN